MQEVVIPLVPKKNKRLPRKGVEPTHSHTRPLEQNTIQRELKEMEKITGPFRGPQSQARAARGRYKVLMATDGVHHEFWGCRTQEVRLEKSAQPIGEGWEVNERADGTALVRRHAHGTKEKATKRREAMEREDGEDDD